MSSNNTFILMISVFTLATSCRKDEQECNPRETGKFLKSSSYTDSSVVPPAVTEQEYFYNEKRQLIEYRMTVTQGDSVTTSEPGLYTYDDCGKLLTFGASDTNFYATRTYRYDADERCVRVDYSISGLRYRHDTITYAGNKITFTRFDGDVKDSIVHECTIDPQTQNVISARHGTANQFSEISYEYDDKINPFRKMQLPLNWFLPWEYSANNMVRQIVTNYPDATANYTYTYDEQGYPLTFQGTLYEYVEF